MLAAYLLLAANVAAGILLLRHGSTVERWAVALVTVFLIATPLLQTFHLGRWRLGIALLEVALFLGFWLLAERGSRWWLVAAAGFQLVAIFTHTIPLLAPEYFEWTQVTIRWVIWVGISATFFVGAWEAWAAERFALEGRLHETYDI